MNRKCVLSALGLVAFTVNLEARAAEDSGFYVGAGVGKVTDGAGAELHLGRTFQLRAEYEVVDVANANFNLLSVSAAVRF